MLPANLAKTRAAGRGAYGESILLNPAGPALRYAPYPLPLAAPTVAAPGGSVPVAAIAVAPAPLHYSVYDVTGCKRVFAAPAATLRPLAARAGPGVLSYSMSDLLGLQGLEIPTLYTNALPAGLGL